MNYQYTPLKYLQTFSTAIFSIQLEQNNLCWIFEYQGTTIQLELFKYDKYQLTWPYSSIP